MSAPPLGPDEPCAAPARAPIVDALLARAPRMSFMQLCRLLELSAPERPGLGTRDTPEHEPVRFRAWPRVGFPAGEVAAVRFGDASGEADPHAPPAVHTTFMGLYGVDAMMPPHMIDDVVLREEGHEVVEAFLDRFHHRLVTLLYRAWQKYRYPERFRAGGNDAHSRNLLSLAGFGWGDKPRRAGLPDARMLALLGLLTQKTRTPEGLAGVVALAVPGAEVRVDEFFPALTSSGTPRPLTSRASAEAAREPGNAPREPRNDAPRGLGGGNVGYVLGRRLVYRSRAVRVTLRPADAQQAHDLLPGAWLQRELMASVQLYVGVKADVHLRMEVSARIAPAPTVGAQTAGPAPRLGWTTVLPADHDRMIAIPLGIHTAFPAPEPNPYLRAPRA